MKMLTSTEIHEISGGMSDATIGAGIEAGLGIAAFSAGMMVAAPIAAGAAVILGGIAVWEAL